MAKKKSAPKPPPEPEPEPTEQHSYGGILGAKEPCKDDVEDDE